MPKDCMASYSIVLCLISLQKCARKTQQALTLAFSEIEFMPEQPSSASYILSMKEISGKVHVWHYVVMALSFESIAMSYPDIISMISDTSGVKTKVKRDIALCHDANLCLFLKDGELVMPP